LTSRITVMTEPQPESPPPTVSASTLLARITSHLSDRLSDPTPQPTLSARLSDPRKTTLADRLESNDEMEIDYGPTGESTMWENLNRPGNFETPSIPSVDNRDLHSRVGNSTPPHYPMDDGANDDDEEGEVGWKKTKRGRRSGNKIQGYRRRDEEREARKRRRQGRR
jgi:hypothetical protein